MKLVTHYLPSLRSNPSPCELMRVLERLPAAGKAQMLFPSVPCCWGTSADPAPAVGGKRPRLVNRQTLCGAPQHHGRVSTFLLLPVPLLGCTVHWCWGGAFGISALKVHSITSLAHSHCVPWIPMSVYKSTFLLGWGWLCWTGSFQQVTWGNIIDGTCQHVLEPLSWAWPQLP